MVNLIRIIHLLCVTLSHATTQENTYMMSRQLCVTVHEDLIPRAGKGLQTTPWEHPGQGTYKVQIILKHYTQKLYFMPEQIS